MTAMSSVSTSQSTRWTLILRAKGQDEQARAALEQLVRTYQRTVRGHVQRWRLPPGLEADDIVQDFFHGLLRRGDLQRVAPEHGKFRTWLARCVDHHMSNQWRSFRTQTSGNSVTTTVDMNEHAELSGVSSHRERGANEALDELLRAEALDVCDETIRRMTKNRKKPAQFELLARLLPGRQLNQEPLSDIAAQLGMKEPTLRDKLNDLRAEFKRTLCQVIADSLRLPDGKDPELHPAVKQELEGLFTALGKAPASSLLADAGAKALARHTERTPA